MYGTWVLVWGMDLENLFLYYGSELGMFAGIMTLERINRVSQFSATADDDLARLSAQRQQRLRDTMREHNTPVLLVLDSVNIQYATGAINMTIFSTRTPAR